MAAFDPDARPLRSGVGLCRRAFRQPQPGLSLENLIVFGKCAVEYEDLHAARRIELDPAAGLPALQPDLFVLILEQGHDFDPWPTGRIHEGRLVGIDTDLGAIRRIELPEFDQDRTAGSGTGSVS